MKCLVNITSLNFNQSDLSNHSNLFNQSKQSNQSNKCIEFRESRESNQFKEFSKHRITIINQKNLGCLMNLSDQAFDQSNQSNHFY